MEERIPETCRFLRTKSSYILLAQEPAPGRRRAAQYWCLKTMRPFGPDEALACPEACTLKRPCFEPGGF